MNTGRPRTPPLGLSAARVLVAAATALGLASLLVGCGSGAPASDPVAGATRYQSLYIGLDSVDSAQPAVLAMLSLDSVEKSFPPPSTFKRPTGLAGDLFVGITLGRLSCRNYYLSEVRFSPRGGPLTLTVAQYKLPPNHACFELIGPPRYQVLALPRPRVSPKTTLSVVVVRPLGQTDRTSITLP